MIPETSNELESKSKIDLIITRHGAAAHNLGGEAKHTFAGSGIDNELTREGEENAHLLAEKIIAQGGCDLIVCSPLLRSKQTAEIIQADLKESGINVRLETISELAEINIGDFAGHTEEEVKQIYPEAASAFYQGRIEDWNFPNGENYEQVTDRAQQVLDIIRSKVGPNARVLVCGHAMLNRVLFFDNAREQENLWQPRSYAHDRIENIFIDSQITKE